MFSEPTQSNFSLKWYIIFFFFLDYNCVLLATKKEGITIVSKRFIKQRGNPKTLFLNDIFLIMK